jgi:large subunit ribosomal protein L22
VTTTDDRIQVRAQAKWVHMSARKARVVLTHLPGRSVPEARTVLAFTQRAAAREIDRVLRSAVANAESAHALDGDELVVVAAYADEGPTMKRWRARARGRVNRIRKRTCHITVVVSPAEAQRPKRPQSKAAPERAETAEPATTSAKPKAARRAPRKKKEAAA